MSRAIRPAAARGSATAIPSLHKGELGWLTARRIESAGSRQI
jgi:hypothetical protein